MSIKTANSKLDMRVLESQNPGIRFLLSKSPPLGSLLEVAEGIWWIQLPAPTQLGHVNVYLLQDGDKLTLVDTGYINSESVVALTKSLECLPVRQFKLTRLIATHYHPDHIGLAGHFHDQGVELWASRSTWALSRLLKETATEKPCLEEIRFLKQAGMDDVELAAIKNRPAKRYSHSVNKIPRQFTPLVEGQNIQVGDRVWTVKLGFGHAPELVTLWSEDIAIVSDQILPSASASLLLPFSEPSSDPVREFQESCQRFLSESDDNILCLPGHQAPFYGAQYRCGQLIENTQTILIRILDRLAIPATARQCVDDIYRRRFEFHERRIFITELMGHMNHLFELNLVEKLSQPDGSLLWKKKT
ncbi:MAG: MBL fold metallo-hydrolase [Pirellulaceae bacterium]